MAPVVSGPLTRYCSPHLEQRPTAHSVLAMADLGELELLLDLRMLLHVDRP
jgi:hypothetical protein